MRMRVALAQLEVYVFLDIVSTSPEFIWASLAPSNYKNPLFSYLKTQYV